MKKSLRNRKHLRPRTDRGSALLIVLTCVVLLALLLVAYLISMRLDQLSTRNYSQSVKAEEIAQGALAEIIGDLRLEINAGSYTNGSPSAGAVYDTGGTRVFIPVTNAAAQPARIGFATNLYTNDISTTLLPPDLIRVSRANDPFFTNPPSWYDVSLLPPDRASAVCSTNVSANGRYFALSRWNKPMLLGTTIPTAFSNAPPDWIYVTRSGSVTIPLGTVTAHLASLLPTADLSQTNAILGRYAYVMYDEGALLDANVAGCLSTATNSATFRGKPFTAYADLTQIPGTNTNSNLTQATIDTFINWRNKGTLSTNSANYTNTVAQLATNGFLMANAGDSPLLGRQDLIDYFTKILHNTNAIPYLTTFSRAVNAPSWCPATPTGSTINYTALAETTGSTNRDLPNLRWPNDATITHYRDDATTVTYNVQRGDPFLQSRFSLARLAWLSQADPNSGNGPTTYASAIQACFGLVWDYAGGTAGKSTMANGGNECWNYIGSSSGASISSPPGTIETLDQVAAEGREPNFFELLKAAILNGSLAVDIGIPASKNFTITGYGSSWQCELDSTGTLGNGNVGYFSWSYDRTTNAADPAKAPARISDVQIMRIGANIIDQYDADSYPTAIYFKYLTGSGTTYDIASGSLGNLILGPNTMIFGDENLPDLVRVSSICCSPQRSGTSANDIPDETDTNTTSMGFWYQPQIWNIHQQPTNTLSQIPKKFQIRAYGEAGLGWNYTAGASATNYHSPKTDYYKGTASPVAYFLQNDPTETSDVGTIIIYDTNSGGNSCLYTHPWELIGVYTNTTNGTVTNYMNGATVSSPSSVPYPNDCNYAWTNYPHYNNNDGYIPNPFIAFCAGMTTNGIPMGAGDPGIGSTYRPYFVAYTNSDSNNLIGGFMDLEPKPMDFLYGPADTYILGWMDSANHFHPYSFLTGVCGYSISTWGANSLTAVCGTTVHGNDCGSSLLDPRTGRFGLSGNYYGGSYPGESTYSPGASGAPIGLWYPPGGSGFSVSNKPYAGAVVWCWAVNSTNTALSSLSGALPYNTYYSDNDGVIRPGDGALGNKTTGDGMILYSPVEGHPTYGAGAPQGTNYSASDKGGNTLHGRRPVILNRPFNSVGELSYTFRDEPFKSIDFFSKYSADAALLDVFSLYDETRVSADKKISSVVAGQVNLNNAPIRVIQSILSGAGKKEIDVDYNINTNDSATIATNIVNYAFTNTLMNRADLVRQLGVDPSVGTTGSGVIYNSFATTDSSDRGNKAYMEAPVRALTDSFNSRTWNLLIDVVAQSGHMSPTATLLSDFVVEGERRYWLHIAIDRYTGKIIARQLEPVYE